jgi:thiamine-phosphate pyrophosphorylase
MIPLPRLYAIADASFGDPVRIAEALFRGGAQLVQVRNKEASSGILLSQVERIMSIAPPGSLVIVNDRVDVARIARAGGVHLGQHDMPVAAARKILGPAVIIGVSTHSAEQAREAVTLPIDYLAIGPIFRTSTKKNPDPVVGIEGLRAVARLTAKPIVAIGGITLETSRDVFIAGAHSIAVIRDLLDAADIAGRVQMWIKQSQSWAS